MYFILGGFFVLLHYIFFVGVELLYVTSPCGRGDKLWGNFVGYFLDKGFKG